MLEIGCPKANAQEAPHRLGTILAPQTPGRAARDLMIDGVHGAMTGLRG